MAFGVTFHSLLSGRFKDSTSPVMCVSWPSAVIHVVSKRFKRFLDVRSWIRQQMLFLRPFFQHTFLQENLLKHISHKVYVDGSACIWSFLAFTYVAYEAAGSGECKNHQSAGFMAKHRQYNIGTGKLTKCWKCGMTCWVLSFRSRFVISKSRRW